MLTHRDRILMLLKKNPDRWFFAKEIRQRLRVPMFCISPVLKRLRTRNRVFYRYPNISEKRVNLGLGDLWMYQHKGETDA